MCASVSVSVSVCVRVRVRVRVRVCVCYTNYAVNPTHTVLTHISIPNFPFHQSSKSFTDPCMGRIIYERSGEFFFIPYAFTDINDERDIHKGDEVSFYMAKNKRCV